MGRDRNVQSSMLLNDLDVRGEGKETNKITWSKKTRSRQERVAEGSLDTVSSELKAV